MSTPIVTPSALSEKPRPFRNTKTGTLATIAIVGTNTKYVIVNHADGRTTRVKSQHARRGLNAGILKPSTPQAFKAAQAR